MHPQISWANAGGETEAQREKMPCMASQGRLEKRMWVSWLPVPYYCRLEEITIRKLASSEQKLGKTSLLNGNPLVEVFTIFSPFFCSPADTQVQEASCDTCQSKVHLRAGKESASSRLQNEESLFSAPFLTFPRWVATGIACEWGQNGFLCFQLQAIAWKGAADSVVCDEFITRREKLILKWTKSEIGLWFAYVCCGSVAGVSLLFF